MRKILIFAVLSLIACNGKHLAWVSDKKEESNKTVEVPALKLETNIGGVQFTFDDGPDLAKTPKILEVLKKHNLQATFFVEGINLDGTSEQAQERRELLKRIMSDGHIIGNHTYDHKDLCKVSSEVAAWELDKTTTLIKTTTGLDKIEYMRPPYGKKCKSLDALLDARKMTAIYWQIDPREWERDKVTHQFKTADQVLDGIMAQYHQLHDEQGIRHMVIILHDTKQVTVDLLPKLLDTLSQQK